MNLYSIHCGFYDSEISDGIYESHVNFFVAAETPEDARAKAKEIPEFQVRKMHVDGVQQIAVVNGHRVQMIRDESLEPTTMTIISHRHRDLAPKKPASI